MTMPDDLNCLDLPPAPEPVGAYVRGILHNGTGYLSGQFPIVGGRLVYQGRLGESVTSEEGRLAAALAAANAIAGIKAVLGDDLNRLVALLRVDGFVAATPDFFDAPRVLDGASQVFLARLGQKGLHARSAMLVAGLPLGSPVELVVTFAAR